MGWLKRLLRPVKPAPIRLEWRKGLCMYVGGESIVQDVDGRIRGQAYKLSASWWASCDCVLIDQFASMEEAKRAVEREIVRKHILTSFQF